MIEDSFMMKRPFSAPKGPQRDAKKFLNSIDLNWTKCGDKDGHRIVNNEEMDSLKGCSCNVETLLEWKEAQASIGTWFWDQAL